MVVYCVLRALCRLSIRFWSVQWVSLIFHVTISVRLKVSSSLNFVGFVVLTVLDVRLDILYRLSLSSIFVALRIPFRADGPGELRKIIANIALILPYSTGVEQDGSDISPGK